MADWLDQIDVLREKDVFRLAIRGHAAVEDAIDATIAIAFGGTTPPELRRLPFNTRLAFVVALTAMPKAFGKAIGSLADVRHEFAHGRVDELSKERADVLGQEFRSVPSEEIGTDLDAASSPRDVLRVCLGASIVGVRVAGDLLKERREDERRAVKLRRGVEQLLAEDD